MRTLAVLGTPLLLTDYVGLSDACLGWARSGRVVALEFSNTQIVTMRRHEPAFREITSLTDGFAPDGMPLIWCLNKGGGGLKDRVYGPIFMRRFLERAPSGFTHYLLGGSEECGRRLREVFQKANPGVAFTGGFHGRCNPDGSLSPADDKRVFDELNRLKPDFIWIGFGTPKQQAWIQRNKHRFSKGVLLSVGFAFDVNAGMKPDAPLWMQRFGLTWIFRLCSEPKRLGPGYFKWNFLFLSYLLADALRVRAIGPKGEMGVFAARSEPDAKKG